MYNELSRIFGTDASDLTHFIFEFKYGDKPRRTMLEPKPVLEIFSDYV